MQAIASSAVAVLVATAHRADTLAQRAFPSIESQSRLPWRVVVVDDSGGDAAAERTERLVRERSPAGIVTDFLRNWRTKGEAGARNSGLDHLLRTCDDPEHLYVAILDDDDRWEPHHLEHCLATAEGRDLDVVAASFQRIEEHAEPRLVAPPRSLDVASFLVGNPGIQGSNLVCRLSVLLEAGLFDEWLPSCTDRDLCIRIAELPGVRYGVTFEPTVNYFACESRPRLSAPGSRAQAEGLDRFFHKYQGRMSGGQQAEFRARAGRLFGWKESSSEPTNGGAMHHAPPSLLSSVPNATAPAYVPPHLIVGMIADAERVAEVRDLLADLHGLAEEPGLSGLDVLLLENGRGRAPGADLRALVEHERERVLRLHLVDRARHLEDAADGLVLDGGASEGRRLSIAPARTVLQTYLYAFAKRRPGAIVWIVDDDMRLDPLVVEKDGRLRRRRLNLVPGLRTLCRLRASGAADIAIGTCTGAPPLPFAATVRVQLVDLAASLRWLASQDPKATLPDHGEENAALRSGRCDYYYDLSRNETDRLETPFRIVPAFPGERVGEALVRMAGAAERVLAGEQIFRPLAVEADSSLVESVGDGLQRGGNTFVLDVEALRLAPNPSLVIDGRPCRRSDMVWTLLQERCFDRRVVTFPIALHHDRSRVLAETLNVECIVDDIRGYAIFSALQNTPGLFTATGDLGIELTEGTIERIAFADRVHEYLEERLAVFRLSFHRIRGLTRVLRRLVDDEEIWWQADEYRAARNQLRAFSGRLADDYRMETLHRIERETKALSAPQIHGFLEQLPVEIEDHRNRLSEAPVLGRGFEGEKRENRQRQSRRGAAGRTRRTSDGVGMQHGKI